MSAVPPGDLPPADGMSGALPANGARPRSLLSGAAFGIRPGEGGIALLFFVYFMLLATCHYIGKSVRMSTFVDVLGAQRLPIAYLLVAILSFPVLLLYAKLTARFRQRVLIIAFCVVQAAGLVAFFALYHLDEKWVAFAFYVWTTMAFGIGLSQFWSFANHSFDARQARRLFAFIGSGGLLGAIVGGQVARASALFQNTYFALLVAAGITLLIIVVVIGIVRTQPHRSDAAVAQETLQRLQAARGGLRALLENRLLVLIAALMFLSMAINQMVDLQFGWVIEKNTEFLDQRTRIFGNFYSIMGVFGFVFQIVFTQRIHRALGVGVGMRILPVSVAVSSILLLLSFTTGMIEPLIAVMVLKLSENSFRHSVEQSTRELLFLPVPSRIRLQAKAFIDVFVQRAGKGVAAIALLPVTLGLMSEKHVGWAVLALTLVWLWVTRTVRREYVRAFREGLKSGIVAEAPLLDTDDVTTMTRLVESLGSSDPRQVLHSMELLAGHGQHRLVSPLLLHHDDPKVRRKTLDVLAEAGRSDAAKLIERSIGDDDPRVRTAAIHALAVLQGEDAADLMVARLDDPDSRLRSAAVASLAASSDAALARRADDALAEMLTDGDPTVRIEAAKAIGEISEPKGADSLVQLLYDSNLDVVRHAIAAGRSRMERDGPNPLYIPILISLMRDRRLKHSARDAVVSHGERAIDALVLFMNSEDEHIWVRRAVPKTIALIGSRAAGNRLIESLDGQDAILRRKIIEALAYLRLRNPDIEFRGDMVARQLRREAEDYLRAFADLWAMSSIHQARLEGPYAQWGASGRVPTLLQQVLAQGMANAVANIFCLMELIHPARDVQAAYRSLVSGQPELRANALEYLDNTLSGSIRRDVFAVIDDEPPEDKLRKASQQFRIPVQAADETLGRLLTTDPDADPNSVQITFAAIFAVYSDMVEVYYPVVRSIATDSPDPLLRETASWVVDRLSRRPAGDFAEDGAADPVAPGGDPKMPHMAQIEKVVFLQGVDLFASCNAEQMLQLASIAEERRFSAGEVVFQRKEPPDVLYCVVEGRIGLGGDDGAVSVTSGDTFGVVDILSGQLRTRSAVAEADTRVLAIEAEDFFDLMSNNIEIVRALFRQLTRAEPEAAGTLL